MLLNSESVPLVGQL